MGIGFWIVLLVVIPLVWWWQGRREARAELERSVRSTHPKASKAEVKRLMQERIDYWRGR
jgi:hypothetical protein